MWSLVLRQVTYPQEGLKPSTLWLLKKVAILSKKVCANEKRMVQEPTLRHQKATLKKIVSPPSYNDIHIIKIYILPLFDRTIL